MEIEYRCEHCNKLVKAPEGSGGRTGKCPHCGGPSYIPRDVGEDGEIPLVPLDEEGERRRQQAVREDAEIQRRLLKENATPGEGRGKGRSGRQSLGTSPTPTVAKKLPVKDINLAIVSFVEAMSRGELDRCEKLAGQLSPCKAQVETVLDEMLGQDLTGYGLPTLPRPVLLGFLKQLRSKL